MDRHAFTLNPHNARRLRDEMLLEMDAVAPNNAAGHPARQGNAARRPGCSGQGGKSGSWEAGAAAGCGRSPPNHNRDLVEPRLAEFFLFGAPTSKIFYEVI